ncbi:MAG: mandelate racemase/muconate lactonizing enzyme family protein [Albidovulum sp.]|nr:mandelate racemase/muconate lactonizing enzyme family protein [Albidovulum sp.]
MLRIGDFDAFAISVPLAKPVRMAGGIVSSAKNLVVRIADVEGRVGWGEAASAPAMTGELPEGMVAAAKFMGSSLVGREFGDFSEVQKLPAVLRSRLHGNSGPKAAIEIALLDLWGKAARRPVFDLLGGKKRDLAPALAMVAGGSLEEEESNARLHASMGCRCFKVKVGVNDPSTDLERCRSIRSALGAEAQISADANQGFTVAEAIEFAKGAKEAGLDFMEQLTDGRDILGMAAAASASDVPLGADEGIHDIEDIRHHHEKRAAMGGSLKPIKLAGLFGVMEAGQLMEQLGMKVNLAGKIAETSIASAAIAHLSAALPQLDWGVSVTCQYLAEDIVRKPIRAENGHVRAPGAPGLGTDPDIGLLEKYRV